MALSTGCLDQSESDVTRSASSTVVYRALIGDYETLREEPVSETSNAEFICFTDDPDLRSDTWRLVLVEPLWPHDAVRSARYLKIMGHPLLSEYERSLWVDNKVELLASPDGIVSDWL